MAATELRLSSKVDKTGKSQVIVKLTVTRNYRPCFKSNVFTRPEWFTPSAGITPPKAGRLNSADVSEAKQAAAQLTSFVSRLIIVCNAFPDKNTVKHDDIENAMRLTTNMAAERITANSIREEADKQEQQKVVETVNQHDFFGWFDYFIEKQQTKQGNPLSFARQQAYRCLAVILWRYEKFVRLTDKKRKAFTWNVETADKETFEDFFSYMNNEKELSEKYPSIFEKIKAHYPDNLAGVNMTIHSRGHNIGVIRKKELKAFFHFLNKQHITNNYPFDDITVGSETYAEPYYLTKEERNAIDAHDLTAYPRLAQQRDIFIFQCYTGCRVSDLMTLTPSMVTNGVLSYIARKTRRDSSVSADVWLHDRAVSIMQKYAGTPGGKLLPCVNSVQYNQDIKKIFTLCGINRVVSVIGSDGEVEQKPLNEIASSHIARRTFAGLQYEAGVRDDVINKELAHAEDKRSFSRYHGITVELLKEAVSKL